MAEFALPPSDEPFDFRHQAAMYGRWRRDYSAALYDAIGERAGPPSGRLAVDVGCGTGFVTTALGRRGWSVVGADISVPMLAQARAVPGASLRLVRARGEALPMRDGAAGLLTCGTSFHWMAPAPALEEFTRVLAPGGWVALFWRYPAPGEPSMRLVTSLLRAVGAPVPADFEQLRVHPSQPFSDSSLDSLPPIVLHSTLEFTAEAYHGYVATIEWVRRFSGAEHANFLDRLRQELADHHRDGFTERNEEYLFLARKQHRPPPGRGGARPT